MKNKLDSRDFKIYLLNTAKVKNGILPYYLKRINAVLSFYKKEFGVGISNEEHYTYILQQKTFSV